jgi:DNA invertase Pin-like site-specific DNA recombinase
MTTFLYARVTTEQTTAHQRTQAEAAGFKIDQVIADEGTSGVSTTLRERKEGKRLFDLLRAGDVLVVRWIDRLGRNYGDICDVVREFMNRGVLIKTIIHATVLDGAAKDATTKAVKDSLLKFMAAAAEAQAEASKEAQRAGIAHAKQNEERAYRGRKPSYDRKQFKAVRDMLDLGRAPIAQIAKQTGLSRRTIYRIESDPVAAEAALKLWEPVKGGTNATP